MNRLVDSAHTIELSPKRTPSRFLIATKAMMEALDAAEGMTSHEFDCFKFNFD